MPTLARFAAAVLVAASATVAQSFVNYESGPVSPLRLSPDGTRLFVADSLGGRLCVYDLRNAAVPLLLAEIPVGLDPVAVAPRTRNEVWVANVLSDNVSIVDVAAQRVVATLPTGDEPSDIVFAGGKAFVTAATVDKVFVFDAVTRASLGTIDVFGKDPRALAVSPDGTRVYAVVQRSGNGTTVLPAGVQSPPPAGPGLPAAPAQGILVRADDPAWVAQIPYTLPDHDVVQIDVATQVVTRYFDRVGTTNTAIAVHPTSGELWVANTEARNLVRFEPNLRGHAIDSRLTRITTGASPVVTAFDLNAGMNYATLPNAAGLSTALAEPFGVAIDAATARVFVAAHGTDRIGVLDLAGTVLARIEIGSTPGAIVNTAQKRGPRALALHPTQPRLYVLNHLSDTLSVVDTTTLAVLREQPIATVDPMPAAMRLGRKFLYDSKLSGNGTMSCASCHIDGDLDGIAWDLGDPNGSLQGAPAQPFPFNLGLTTFHPMKGPMTTQTLRGLSGTGFLHWRGDRGTFQDFNPTFDTLMGGSQLSASDMNAYAAFANAIAYPPNPNQLKNRALRTTPAGNNEAAGQAAFLQNVATFPIPGGANCATCHSLPRGTNGFVINGPLIQEPQQMKVPQLRNMYRKVGFLRAPGQQKSGFGFVHDGAIDTLASFLAQPVFSPWPAGTKDDLVTFMMALDTGTAPLVGYQFVLTQLTAGTPSWNSDSALAIARTAAGDVDLTVHGLLDGRLAGLLYQPGGALFVSDRTGEGPFTLAQLVTKAQAGTASLAFTAVAPGTGNRIALDRDGDGTRNGDEGADNYGLATAGCSGVSTLAGNSEPRLGNAAFGMPMRNAPANGLGLLGLAFGRTSLPILGITLLVDPLTAVPVPIYADAFGDALQPFAIPASPVYTGLEIDAQALWLDACGSELWSSSAGLAVIVRP
jgi:YVTN family beta-propeller protein